MQNLTYVEPGTTLDVSSTTIWEILHDHLAKTTSAFLLEYHVIWQNPKKMLLLIDASEFLKIQWRCASKDVYMVATGDKS